MCPSMADMTPALSFVDGWIETRRASKRGIRIDACRAADTAAYNRVVRKYSIQKQCSEASTKRLSNFAGSHRYLQECCREPSGQQERVSGSATARPNPWR